MDYRDEPTPQTPLLGNGSRVAPLYEFHGETEPLLRMKRDDVRPEEPEGCWRTLVSCVTWLPCCPVRRRAARLIALWLMCLAAWCTVWLLLGSDAAPPAGPLWRLFLLVGVAKAGGWVAVQVRLPGLLGMLLVGVTFQATGVVKIEGPYLNLVSVVRKAALVIILMRAGLDLDPVAIRRMQFTIMRLGVLPWAFEAACVAYMSRLLFDLPWSWAFLLGAVEGALSPAVVVPNLILLRERGFGVVKGVPTLVLAVCGIEDAVAISSFGVIGSVMFSSGSLAWSVARGPASVGFGVVGGVLLGLLARIVPDKTDPYKVSMRIFVLLLGGLLAVLGSEHAGFGGAGPLAVIITAYVASSGWEAQGWKVGENQVALTFGVIWQFFEPAVFGLVGAQIGVTELPARTVGLAAACVFAPVVLRFLFTQLLLCGSAFNGKERVFVALSWMAKATVQAVLGPAALDLVRGSSDEADVAHAQVVFVVSVLCILFTAPLGAVLIATTGPRLLDRDAPATPAVDPESPEDNIHEPLLDSLYREIRVN